MLSQSIGLLQIYSPFTLAFKFESIRASLVALVGKRESNRTASIQMIQPLTVVLEWTWIEPMVVNVNTRHECKRSSTDRTDI